jgi:hypothetical protein
MMFAKIRNCLLKFRFNAPVVLAFCAISLLGFGLFSPAQAWQLDNSFPGSSEQARALTVFGNGTCFMQAVVYKKDVGSNIFSPSFLRLYTASSTGFMIGGGIFSDVETDPQMSFTSGGVVNPETDRGSNPSGGDIAGVESRCGLESGTFKLVSSPNVAAGTSFFAATSFESVIEFGYQGRLYRGEFGIVSQSAELSPDVYATLTDFGASNAAPTASGVPSEATVVEDAQSDLDLRGTILADSDGDNLTVTISVTSGALSAVSSGDVVVGGNANALTLSGSAGAINSFLSSQSAIQYTTAPDASGSGIATATISASDTAAGLATNPTVSINALTVPDVTRVSGRTSNGHYREGSVIEISVFFDEAVWVTGTPVLTLETGNTDRIISYSNGSGRTELVFNYTVQAGDTTGDLDYVAVTSLSANGGFIRNIAGRDADIGLPSPAAAGSLSANSELVVDTTAPVLSIGNISLSGATGTNGAFKIGDTITATWNALGGDGDINLSASLGDVTVDFSAFGGSNQTEAIVSGSVWTATYRVVAESSTTGTALNLSVTAWDEAGNTTTTTADTSGTIVDAVSPTVSTALLSLSGATGTGGTFRIGDTLTVTWNNDANGDGNSDISAVSVDFAQFGGGLVVADNNGSDIWTASYTITNGSIDLTDRNIALTVFDLAGNSTLQMGTANVGVDNISPTIADREIAVSGSTGPSGAFKIGDAVSVAWTANDTDAIDSVLMDFSAFDGPVDAVAVLSGGVWTATYVLQAGSLSAGDLLVAVTALDNAGNPLTIIKAEVYAASTVVPTVTVTGPTEIVTTRFTVIIDFSESMSSDLVASELRVENGTVAEVAAVSGSSSQFTAEIDPVLGNTVLVQVMADSATSVASGNLNTASNEFTVFAGNVATAFDEYRAQIRQVLVEEAERALRSTLSSNRRMMQAARGRFMADQRDTAACGDERHHTDTTECDAAAVSGNDIAIDVDGGFALDGTTLSTSGVFFGQTLIHEGHSRRLVFGDFDVQHDGETGSSTATLTGRLAWERKVSDNTMLGYFVGGELAHGNIAGAFSGDQTRIGVTVGGYAVHELARNTYLEGFVTLGSGRNNLEMANDVLALTSDYTTRSVTFGAASSAVIEQPGYEIRPELSFSYGRTWIGDVALTGRAYGLVDNALSVDAGSVTLASVMLRPEFRVPLDGLSSAESLQLFTFAPRLICEQVKTTVTEKNCGGGAEIGFTGQFGDGQSTYSATISSDRLGDQTSSALQLNLEHRF